MTTRLRSFACVASTGFPRRRGNDGETARDGRARYTDAEFDDYDLVVEIDGRQHTGVWSWWEDMNWQNDLIVRHGKTVLRFPGFVVRQHGDVVAATLGEFFRRTPPK